MIESTNHFCSGQHVNQNKYKEKNIMLSINMDDLMNVVNSCKSYLIGILVALGLAIIVTIAVMKMK